MYNVTRPTYTYNLVIILIKYMEEEMLIVSWECQCYKSDHRIGVLIPVFPYSCGNRIIDYIVLILFGFVLSKATTTVICLLIYIKRPPFPLASIVNFVNIKDLRY